MFLLIGREWIKITRRPSTYLMIGLFVAFLLYSYLSVGVHYMHSADNFFRYTDLTPEQFQQYVVNAPSTSVLKAMVYIVSPHMVVAYMLAVLNAIGPFFAAILGAQLFGDEYQFRTIRILWTEGPSRFAILASKITVLALVFLAAMAGSCVIGLILSLLIHWIYPVPWLDASLSWTQWFIESGVQWIATWISLLLWSSFSAMVAAAARSPLAGSLAGIGYPIAEQAVLDPWPIRIFLPLWNQKSTLPIAFEQVTGGTVHFEKLTGMVSLEIGLIISAGYFLLFTGLLYLTFRYQETI